MQSCCVTGHVNHSIFWQNLTPPKVGSSSLLCQAPCCLVHFDMECVLLTRLQQRFCHELNMHAMTQQADVCLLRYAWDADALRAATAAGL